jgi:hypothetical protein
MHYHLQGLFLPPGIDDFFLHKLGEMISELKEKTESNKSPEAEKAKTVVFVALYLFYSRQNVTRENVDSIGTDWGFKNGQKLIQEYHKVLINTDRKADPESLIKLNNKIKLFEEVSKHLEEHDRSLIIDDLKSIKDYLKKY